MAGNNNLLRSFTYAFIPSQWWRILTHLGLSVWRFQWLDKVNGEVYTADLDDIL